MVIIQLILVSILCIGDPLFAKALQPSGPNVCMRSTRGNTCCPGWEQRHQDGKCLIPICSYGCGVNGICVAPNICKCQDGIVASACRTEVYVTNRLCNALRCHQKCHIRSEHAICSCFPGFSLATDRKTCIDIDECSDSKSCQKICVNTIGSSFCPCDDQFITLHGNAECLKVTSNSKFPTVSHKNLSNTLRTYCPSGYIYNQLAGRCSDIDECSNRRMLRCDHICVNIPGSYHCLCRQGYKLHANGHTCRRIVNHNECFPKCVNGGTCINQKCICRTGIYGKACEKDVNECDQHANSCEYECRNTFGSFQCVCPDGYVLNSDQRTCNAISCLPECMNGGECIKGRCICPLGFKGQICSEDRNECKEKVSGCEYMCRNMYGSYACLCPPRSYLKADKHSCHETKICLHKCRNGGTCSTGRCLCPQGLTGLTCTIDRNECSTSSHDCSHGCYNTYGSYKCYCPKRMVLSTDGKTCFQRVEASPSTTGQSLVTKEISTTPSTLVPTNSKTTLSVTTKQTSRETNMRSTISKDEEISKLAEEILDEFKQLQNNSIDGENNEPYVLTMNKNMLNSMVADFKSRRRAINKKGNAQSAVLISAKTELPCFYIGTEIPSGMEMLTGENNCTTCQCSNGELRCSQLQCPELECSTPIHGHCCNRCPNDCIFDKKVRKNGEYFSPENDPCKTCICSAGVVTCQDAPCPILDCEVNSQFLPPGQCCAECILVKKVVSKTSRNIKGCKYRNILYDIGDSWIDPLDKCTFCECEDKESVDCFSLDCNKELCDNILVKQCCSICNECEVNGRVLNNREVTTRKRNGRCEDCTCQSGKLSCHFTQCNDTECEITFGNKKSIHGHGEIFSIPNDNCVKCLCQNGKISCFATECQSNCKDGVKIPGKCCPICQDCEFRGKIYQNMQSFERRETCEMCSCQNGNVSCNKIPDCSHN